jgi:hypothetical protein
MRRFHRPNWNMNKDEGGAWGDIRLGKRNWLVRLVRWITRSQEKN